MLFFIMKCKKIYDAFVRDEVTVYAAQASFFTVLSSLPFIMILLTLIQLIPSINRSDLLDVLCRLVPQNVEPLMETVVTDLYTTAPAALLSATTIATIWSASRGMLSIERGLNRIAGCGKRRGYLLSRLVNSGYTIVFIFVCIFSLALMVFGASLQRFFLRCFPVFSGLAPLLVGLRILLALAILILFFMGLYTFLPYERQKLKRQLPGAVFSTLGWVLCSYGFSIYFNFFSRFSYMYGSLAAVVILMLWIYFCICILFLGAEVNRYWK